MKRRNARGMSAFNLVELLIVLVLIAVIFRLTFPAWLKFKGEQMVQNAAAEFSRDIEWAKALSERYEAAVYVDFLTEDQYRTAIGKSAIGNSMVNSYSIYKTTPVPRGSEVNPSRPNYGSANDPFALKNLRDHYGSLKISGSSVNGTVTQIVFQIGGTIGEVVDITLDNGVSQATFRVELSGKVNFGAGGL